MADERPAQPRSRVKLAGIAGALIILVLFIALNFEDVEVDLLVASPTIPLALALILTALLGFLVGYFFPRRR